jgi:NAD(P)-dependent dehydrogenase (short-subunit alcohol dehydrogenase family)
MTPEFSGKTALITGATRGIGLAIAQKLLECGCKVAINSRNAADLQAVATTMAGVIGLQADVTRSDDATRLVTDVVAHFGKLDMLVCNVGSGRSVPPGEETIEEWQRAIALNLNSATNMVEAARESLAKAGGTIVCISSICGVEHVPGAPVTYSVAKAALNAYVRGIARPLGKLGIRINAIATGNMLFPGSVWERKLAENPIGVQDMLSRDVALGKLGSPQDVSELASFLLSEKSGFATGAIWTLDGGQVRG